MTALSCIFFLISAFSVFWPSEADLPHSLFSREQIHVFRGDSPKRCLLLVRPPTAYRLIAWLQPGQRDFVPKVSVFFRNEVSAKASPAVLL